MTEEQKEKVMFEDERTRKEAGDTYEAWMTKEDEIVAQTGQIVDGNDIFLWTKYKYFNFLLSLSF